MTPDEILAEWKAIYAELNKGRNPDAMRYDDSTFAAVVMLSRQIERAAKTRVIEPAFARDYDPRLTAESSGKRGANHAD